MIAVSYRPTLYDSTSYDNDGAISALMGRYMALPRHIAKKHLKAAMRRVLRPGVSILRQNTPPTGVRRGRREAGVKAASTGDLRRAATVRTGTTGKNADGFVWGVLGYKAGLQSRKAIWLEYGTKTAKAFEMMKKSAEQLGNPVAQQLAAEMAKALEKAAKEVASGKNPIRDFGRAG
jgi:hypothetical protein